MLAIGRWFSSFVIRIWGWTLDAEVSARRPHPRPLNNSQMKFAICNEIFQGWKLEDTFARAAKIGYDAVEIAPFTVAKSVADVSANERQGIRDSATGAGIVISGIHWVLAQAEGLHLTHPDGG